MKRPVFVVGEIAAISGVSISAYLNNATGVAFYGLVAATLPILAYRNAKGLDSEDTATRTRMLQTLITADVIIFAVALLMFATAADSAEPALGWLAGFALLTFFAVMMYVTIRTWKLPRDPPHDPAERGGPER